MNDLRETMAEAESFGDPGRLAAARAEFEALSAELSRAVGLGGRTRRAGSAGERARVAVQRRVRDAIRRIEEAVLAAAGERPAVPAQAPAGLTEREVEVLRLLARGYTNRQIAAELGIAVKTAGNHVQSTLEKIGVRTRAGAAMFAMRHGIAS